MICNYELEVVNKWDTISNHRAWTWLATANHFPRYIRQCNSTTLCVSVVVSVNSSPFNHHENWLILINTDSLNHIIVMLTDPLVWHSSRCCSDGWHFYRVVSCKYITIEEQQSSERRLWTYKLKGALDNLSQISFWDIEFHLSCKEWLLIYKYKKKNSKFPTEVKKSSVFVNHA